MTVQPMAAATCRYALSEAMLIIDPPIRESILRLMRAGYSLHESARALGIASSQVRATRRAHAEWSRELEEIESVSSSESLSDGHRELGLRAIAKRLMELASRARAHASGSAGWN